MNTAFIDTLNIHISLAMPALNPTDFDLFGKLLKFANPSTPPAERASRLTPPAIGEYWSGQGGIYAGVRQYPEGLCHVVFAKEDVGDHTWGENGTNTAATHKADGYLNIAALPLGRDLVLAAPAALAASRYEADGHKDFYLPAVIELNHAWATVPESFEQEWYWSSTQHSPSQAFLMAFGSGGQYYSIKTRKLLVRPIRRFIR